MNRREFLIRQAAFLGAFGSLNAFGAQRVWAGFRTDRYAQMDWDEYLVEPVALPTGRAGDTSLFAIPSPIQREWSRQPTPDFSRVQRQIVGLRPFRRGGFRLEREDLFSGRKQIVHNYGYGGAGITLAWGAAELALEKLSPIPSGTPVAVLGAGVIGLSTAYVLLEKGYQVRIYSEQFHPDITSSVAGGQFAPSVVEAPRGVPMNDVVYRSWRRYAELEGQGVGVSYRPNFLVTSRSTFDRFPKGTIPGGRSFPMRRLPFSGPARSGSYAWTMLIEPPIYLPWLTREIERMGGVFQQRGFRSRQDLQSLAEDVIVNCTGLGSKALFADRAMIGVRGQLVLLEPQNLEYLLSYGGGYVFSREDAVVLGGTFEYGVESLRTTPQAYSHIMRKNKEFFGVR